MRVAARQEIEDLTRDLGKPLTGGLEVRARLAELYADLVDRAARDGDAAGLVRYGDKLTATLDALRREGVNPGDGGTGDGAGDERRGLHAVIDSPPTLGDAAHG